MIGRERTVGIRLEFWQEMNGGKTGKRAIECETVECVIVPIFELFLDVKKRVENGDSVWFKKREEMARFGRERR